MISIFRQTQRAFSTVLSHSNLETAIPGIRVYENFFGAVEKKSLRENALVFGRKITADLEGIPLQQCIKSKNPFQMVEVVDRGRVKGKHFKDHDEKGHGLTYFSGNGNLPPFVKTALIARMLQLPAISSLNHRGLLDWNLSFNTYTSTRESLSGLSGIGFHKDISLEELTMIYSLGNEAILSIREPSNPEQVQKIALRSNSLVLLSKEACRDFKSRVVSVTTNSEQPLGENNFEAIQRVTLVFGCVFTDFSSLNEEKSKDRVWDWKSV